ncbi:hypothetical protein CONPUDRAFT_77975 [Coniophora puteana RWD-64-598 SS2]|uniref:Protein kinase domain-containing protein n=1 Tax=Coniophora puteana (strain RWD-64-598) TaxID=741705 RepID=R7SEW7_CONPW|nr:uncharacterized protein CONPUDRAFT_77975 [Coniophora puteana RWD-64-598 SS2]EIW74711.1 hypothetical protein CONPUDRAFT_77975 [Coniophora puteana RWD-64-598 SS2]
MATLQFPLDLSKLGEDDEFASLDADSSVAPPLDSISRRIAHITQFISPRGASSNGPPENIHAPFVFRAKPDSQWDGKDSVICKAGYGRKCAEKLKKEARIYSGKLSSLQGICVPRLYGSYSGLTEDGRLAVLVMEDCGEPLTRPLERLPRRAKKLMLECLVELHKAGIEHGGTRDRRNIVIRPSKTDVCELRFVGFGGANHSHACDASSEFLNDVTRPGLDRVDCKEIYQAYNESELWDKDHIVFYNKEVPTDQVTKAEDLWEVTGVLDELKEHGGLRDWEVRNAAREAFNNYCDWRRDVEASVYALFLVSHCGILLPGYK